MLAREGADRELVAAVEQRRDVGHRREGSSSPSRLAWIKQQGALLVGGEPLHAPRARASAEASSDMNSASHSRTAAGSSARSSQTSKLTDVLDPMFWSVPPRSGAAAAHEAHRARGDREGHLAVGVGADAALVRRVSDLERAALGGHGSS